LSVGTAIAADGPAPAPLRIIGGQASGCIAGAVELPSDGPGFQTIRNSRSAHWGAPSTIAAVETLAAELRRAGLPDLYIGDISRPRGGPMPGGHFSHQLGLDADIYLDLTPKPALTPQQRDAIEVASVVLPDQRNVDPARWSAAHVTLLKLAASLRNVDRILVSFAIKRQLCDEVTGDRTWLHLIRPWWDHAAHMHIRFRCPVDQPDCIQAPPPPPGDGCDATLQWWFDQLSAPAKPPGPLAKPPPLPAACKAVMEAPAALPR
jgi:penicillin-insensitive murein endopeptidase